MANQIKSATVIINDASVGSRAWTNPTNASDSDNAYAVATGVNSNFGTGNTVRDSSIRLVKGGTIVGDDNASATNWTDEDVVATYGGSSDLWGATWTSSDINADDFGIVVSAQGPSWNTTNYLKLTDFDFAVPDGSTINGITARVERQYYTLSGSDVEAHIDHVELEVEYSEPAAWYDDAWSYRTKITIAASEVDANVTDFPVFIDLEDLDSDFHSNVKSDASDIRVTTDDGETEVPREVVYYSSANDNGDLHFNAPSLSSSVDTEFYIYYGNSGASDYAEDATYGSENVWTNSYAGVWHAANDGVDSTSNDNDMTATGNASVSNSSTGPFTSDMSFDNAGDYYTVSSLSGGPSGSQLITISAWYNLDTLTGDGAIFSIEDSSDDLILWYNESGNTNSQAVTFNSGNTSDQGNRIDGPTDAVASTWEMTTAVRDGTTRSIYKNGSFDGSSTGDTANIPSGSDTRIGAWATTPNMDFDGKLSGVRVANVARVSGWISTEYNNQNDPSSFYSSGPEEEPAVTSETFDPDHTTDTLARSRVQPEHTTDVFTKNVFEETHTTDTFKKDRDELDHSTDVYTNKTFIVSAPQVSYYYMDGHTSYGGTDWSNQANAVDGNENTFASHPNFDSDVEFEIDGSTYPASFTSTITQVRVRIKAESTNVDTYGQMRDKDGNPLHNYFDAPYSNGSWSDWTDLDLPTSGEWDATEVRNLQYTHAYDTGAPFLDRPVKLYGVEVEVTSETGYTHSTDSFLRSQVSVDHTTDSILRASVEETHSTDIYTKSSYTLHTDEIDFDFTNPFLRVTPEHTTDTSLRAVVDASHTTDTLARDRSELSHSADVLSRSQNTEQHTTDALIREIESLDHSTDTLALLRAILSHSSDVLLRSRYELAHTTNLLLRDALDASHYTDALLRSSGELDHNTDFIARVRDELAHATDVLARSANQIEHTTDTFTRYEVDLSHDTDSLLRTGGDLVHTTDSLLRLSEAISHTTDTLARSTNDRTHTTDVLLRVVDGLSHSTDTLLRDVDALTHNTDVLLLSKETLSHSTDSLLRKRVLGEASTDVYYFDGHNGITDLNGIWAGDANAFNGNSGNGASTTQKDGTKNNKYLQGEGTTAPTSGNQISQVRVRVRGADYGSINGQGLTITVYDSDIVEELGTVGTRSDTPVYSDWLALSEISGGWTWEEVSNLVVRGYNAGTAYGGFFIAEVEVTSLVPFGHSTDILTRSVGQSNHSTDILSRAATKLTHTTDTTSRASVEISHTADSVLRAIEGLSHSTDTALLGARVAVHGTDTLLRAVTSVSHASDSLLRSTEELNHSADTYLYSLIDQSHSTDTLTRAVDEADHSTDISLFGVNQKSHTSDTLARLREAVEHTTDTLLKSRESSDHDTDVLTRAQETLVHASDILLRSRLVTDHATDTYLKAITGVSHSTNILATGTGDLVHSTNALLRAIDDANHSTDTLLKTREELDHTTDATLRSEVSVEHETDTLLREQSELEHSTDVLSRAIGSLQHSTDSYLRAVEDALHSTDVLAKGVNTVDHTTDVSVVRQVTVEHSTDLLTYRQGALPHSTDSYLRAIREVSHGADIRISQFYGLTHDTDVALHSLKGTKKVLVNGQWTDCKVHVLRNGNWWIVPVRVLIDGNWELTNQ